MYQANENVDFKEQHLSWVEGLVCGVIVVEETHVDKVNEEAGGILGAGGVIGCPLIKHEQNKVAKKARHENNLRNKAKEDV